MRKRWRMFWSMTGVASLCAVGGPAMGQVDYEAPQYPQYVQYPQGAPPVAPAIAGAQVTLTPAQIDQLLGPIALYPDPLLSLIFPAATYPQDVVAAEQWLASVSTPTEAEIAAQSWDGSIKGLVHYSTVLAMMSSQIDWTQAVGAAFLNQQKDVMASVQRLRALAEAAKNLQTTQQEQVLAEAGTIRIEPTDPNTMYVPQYDPNVVYSSAYPISFGVGWPIGLWCDNDFDWNGQYIVFGGGWYRGWHHPREWDDHPPAWDRHPPGWAAAPRPWVRTESRPAPRLTAAVIGRVGLDRPRGATGVSAAPGVNRRLPAPLPIGKSPVPLPSRNAFDSTNSRADVQRSVQRARPAPVQLPTRAQPVAPQRTYQQAPPGRAPVPQRSAPPQSAHTNAFSGGSAGATRAQSARGSASRGRR